MGTKRNQKQSMNLNSRNTRSLLLVTAQFVVIAIAIFYFFVPYIQDILDFRNDIDTKQQNLNELTKYANYLADLADSTLVLEKELVDYALPSENDVITVILTYEGIAQEVEGVAVSPISLEPGVLDDASEEKDSKESSDKDSGLKSLDFSLSAEAINRESAEALFKELYSARRIFVVHDVGWAVSENDAIALELEVSAYHMSNPAVVASKALVKEGQEQQEFLSKYKDTKIYEELVLDGVKMGKSNLFRPEGNFYDPEATLSAGLQEIPQSSSSAELELDIFARYTPTPTPDTTTTEERVFEELFGDILP